MFQSILFILLSLFSAAAVATSRPGAPRSIVFNPFQSTIATAPKWQNEKKKIRFEMPKFAHSSYFSDRYIQKPIFHTCTVFGCIKQGNSRFKLAGAWMISFGYSSYSLPSQIYNLIHYRCPLLIGITIIATIFVLSFLNNYQHFVHILDGIELCCCCCRFFILLHSKCSSLFSFHSACISLNQISVRLIKSQLPAKWNYTPCSPRLFLLFYHFHFSRSLIFRRFSFFSFISSFRSIKFSFILPLASCRH